MNILINSTLNLDHQLKLKQELAGDNKLIFKNNLSNEELSTELGSVEVIFGNPPLSIFNNELPHLQFWQIDSAGFDQYQQLKLDIPVANMGTFFALSCAETIVGGILCFYRQIHQLVRLQSQKKWEGKIIRTQLQGMKGKNVLILGTGAIALAVKKLLSRFDCQIRTTARNNPLADLHDTQEILDILPNIDVIINTLPGTADKYVATEFFESLKPGSLYASVGRGNTTDEAALTKALHNGVLAGAVLDVTAIEPLPTTHVFWDMENIILTQHTGGGDENEDDGKLDQFIKNFNKFVAGEPIDDLVNLQQGY
ncbi:D-2-hydroxyacid dehydrogenase [Pedobacter sp.]|uniref:D-2-hydroxyacid dehydrogenase n=1 Tax=Pedobacter sp. TaxID=1411316 RepID=UPI003D7F269F